MEVALVGRQEFRTSCDRVGDLPKSEGNDGTSCYSMVQHGTAVGDLTFASPIFHVGVSCSFRSFFPPAVSTFQPSWDPSEIQENWLQVDQLD